MLDAAGNLTTMSYDQMGRKTGMHDPDMGEWAYGYDAAGNMVWQRDARQPVGQYTCLQYDDMDRVTRKFFPLPGEPSCPPGPSPDWVQVNYGYDDTSGGNAGLGRRTSVDKPGVAFTSWFYDGRG